jgi:hypothetical protein
MKIFFTNLFVGLAILLGTIAVFIGIPIGSYQLYKYLAPKYANVQNEIYQNNASYNEGMVRDFENLRMEYMNQTDPSKKAVIRSVILHRFSVYGINKLPVDLQNFYSQMEATR